MPATTERPIAIFYEHPDWFRPLFAELDRRGTPYVKIHAAYHQYDPSLRAPYSLVFNRISPSAWQRGHEQTIFYALQFLKYLKQQGVRVVNGYDAFVTETSKAHQQSLLTCLGLPVPRARVVNQASEIPSAAEGFRFPVIVKPNIGGSGAGIRKYNTPEQLALGMKNGGADLGIDHTALVQEFIPQYKGRIVRVEVLGGRYLYAIRIYTPGDSFNLCPADVCQTVGGEELVRAACPVDAPKNQLRVEGYEPPFQQIKDVERIMEAAGIEVGGVEYFVDDRDGRLYYYDINALSNFVADAPRVVGIDAFAKLADFLEAEAA